jgi:hypothetical protein
MGIGRLSDGFHIGAASLAAGLDGDKDELGEVLPYRRLVRKT